MNDIKQPTLKCSNDNIGGKLSKFTVDDTINGNGNLTYKIGLLTADEIAFAGSAAFLYNRSSYLQENTGTSLWWSLSPSNFQNGKSRVLYVRSGSLSSEVVTSSGYVRPAISLVSDTEISGGSGTSEDPYVVK